MTREAKLWADESGTTWWEVTQEGADPVGLQGPGPCRGLQYVPRLEFDSRFTLVTAPKADNNPFSKIMPLYKPSKKLGMR